MVEKPQISAVTTDSVSWSIWNVALMRFGKLHLRTVRQNMLNASAIRGVPVQIWMSRDSVVV